MKQIVVNDAELRKAAETGMDAFVRVFVDAIRQQIGELTAETMAELNSDQITLLAWDILHEEVMDGGFVQLIHNGYGPFIFKNPFAKALAQMWGMDELSKIIKKTHKLYSKFGKDIEADCTDEEFMALFEQYPQFDDYDDLFVENEEQYTGQVARYIDDNIEKFAIIA